jgi:hypothetical protein
MSEVDVMAPLGVNRTLAAVDQDRLIGESVAPWGI